MSLPHRNQVLEVLENNRRSMGAHEIASRLRVAESYFQGLIALLDDMALSGELVAVAGDRFRLAQLPAAKDDSTKPSFVSKERSGVLSMNPRGFAFVSTPKSGEPDVFISAEKLGGAMHGDHVQIRVGRPTAKGLEGEVIQITKRAQSKIAGTLRKRGKSVWIEPDDARLRGPIQLRTSASNTEQQNALNDAKDGDAVLAEISRYPVFANELPEGNLTAVLGQHGDPTVEILKILLREDIRETFPEQVVADAQSYGQHVRPEEIQKREDLRSLRLITIDPHDARDHDDAVFVQRVEQEQADAAFIAYIAIADVSSYVKPSMALDTEARRRGCTVYLPDRAVPMLPRELSSHLCSLLPNQDRLCLTVEVALDAVGTPLRHRFIQGVMRSHARLSYEDAARVLGSLDDVPPTKEALAFAEDIRVANELSTLLRARRLRRGALDFDLPEPKVKLDEKGTCIDVVRARANPGVKKAYSLIEELMLLANEVVAEELTGRTIPTVYRVHGTPDETKLDSFASLAQTLGVAFTLDDVRDPKSLGKFLKAIASHPQASVMNSLLLRSMKQATYDVVNVGHFGLASSAYVHFTSPIRRYPDILVHRAVHALCSGVHHKHDDKSIETLKEAAVLASTTERKAMQVEREVVDLHRALLMRTRVGDIFEGILVGFSGSGAYVSIESPFVDVLGRYENMGEEAFILDDDGLSAKSPRSGDTVRLGEGMTVRVDEISIVRRQILGTRLARKAYDVDEDKVDPPRRSKKEKARKGKHPQPPESKRSKTDRLATKKKAKEKVKSKKKRRAKE